MAAVLHCHQNNYDWFIFLQNLGTVCLAYRQMINKYTLNVYFDYIYAYTYMIVYIFNWVDITGIMYVIPDNLPNWMSNNTSDIKI